MCVKLNQRIIALYTFPLNHLPNNSTTVNDNHLHTFESKIQRFDSMKTHSIQIQTHYEFQIYHI